MVRVKRVKLPIQDQTGRLRGHIHIHLLPDEESGEPAPLLDRRGDLELEPGMAGVQLLEGHEYRYKIELEAGAPNAPVSTDRPEIFRRDDESGASGSIRPGLYTGTLPVNVRLGEQVIGSFELEVRARKLDYLSHYKWMMGDLADIFSEVIMRRFAPAETRFTVRSGADAATLYQRFAFLRSLIQGDPFESALAQILSYPHREWREEHELRPSGQPIPSGPDVVRAMTRAGPRVPWAGSGLAMVDSLPTRMPVKRSFETYDTLPNRFVKHVLVYWRNTVAQIAQALARAQDSFPKRRGLAETHAVLSYLDEVLAQPLFRQVGPLTQPPAANQVLQKRPGYRDMYRLHVQSELAAMLAWSGGEDVYRAGQKDVATLYEYWVFVQLARIVSSLCHKPLQLERLLEEGPDGLDLRLKRGTQKVLSGEVTRRGRTMVLELWYNRSFPSGQCSESWTRRVRPDCSLRISFPGYAGIDEMWLHFDAKYRVETLLEIFGNDATSPEEGTGTDDGGGSAALPVPEDLLKMHAYRDAIRRTSGAYVIYPGDKDQVHRRYHEILPGLGAFALRPSGGGTPDGADAIRQFISDVLDHAATQVSQHERYRYWEKVVFCEQELPGDWGRQVRAVPFLKRPPADTRVLLGYVRDADHFNWIVSTGFYNMRADDRSGSVGLRSEQLAAEIVLLYGPEQSQASLWRVSGDPRLMTRERMLELGYPNPRSTVYYCLPLEPLAEGTEAVRGLTFPLVERLVRELAPESPYGAPVATTWARLVGFLAAHTGGRL